MKIKLKLAIISCTITASILFPNLSWARSIEQEIQSTGVLKVGVREDSPLFGFGGEKTGYCADFAQELATNLSQKLGKTIKVNLVKSTTQNRWDLVNGGTVHFECGPNTMVRERERQYGIKFSEPFFVTATQIFLRAGTIEETLTKGTIGIIGGTTNERDIRQIYPEVQINDSFERRSHGIVSVQLGEITGFASDGILLAGTASVLEINPQKYTMVTPLKNNLPFCAAYGMILPGDEENSQWRNTVNSLISNSEQGKPIWDKWFQDFLPHIGAVLNACQSNQQNNTEGVEESTHLDRI